MVSIEISSLFNFETINFNFFLLRTIHFVSLGKRIINFVLKSIKEFKSLLFVIIKNVEILLNYLFIERGRNLRSSLFNFETINFFIWEFFVQFYYSFHWKRELLFHLSQKNSKNLESSFRNYQTEILTKLILTFLLRTGRVILSRVK